jgi:hypothetical protein
MAWLTYLSAFQDWTAAETSERVRWTPLVGQLIGLNKVVGLAARKTPTGLARPLQLCNFLMY